MEIEKTKRARRARYEDIVALREELASLRTELAAMQAVGSTGGGGVMSEDEFKARAVIATLQSGGWGQLKYVPQRASEAYNFWLQSCGRTD